MVTCAEIQAPEERGIAMRRLFVWASLLSGIAAAYLMYKRGESLGNIASRTVSNPVGTLATEIKNAL